MASSPTGSEVAIGTGTEAGSSSSSVWAGTRYVVSSVRALLTLTSWTPGQWTGLIMFLLFFLILPVREIYRKGGREGGWEEQREGGREKERERERERESTFTWFKHLPDISPSLPLTVYPSVVKIWTRLLQWSCIYRRTNNIPIKSSPIRASGEIFLLTKFPCTV